MMIGSFGMHNIRVVLAVIVTVTLCYGLHGIRMGFAERAKERALEAQKTLLVEGCQKAQKHTQQVSNGLQNQLKTINSRHADAVSRLLKHEAYLCSERSPGRYDAASGGNGLSNAFAILDLGAAAERQTQQLIACQEYVRGLR
jgi:hypothetical protein